MTMEYHDEHECHRRIWAAIDRMARGRDMSVSALAKQSGLDATSLNVSKRCDGKALRWPSTRTIGLLLHRANMTPVAFAQLMAEV